MRQIILILSVMITVLSQTLWKIGAGSAKIEGEGVWPILIAYIKSPLILLGFGLSAVAAFMWAYALAELDFNYASFISSLSYVFVIIVALVVFKETISPGRWAGCGFIFIGILLVLRS